MFRTLRAGAAGLHLVLLAVIVVGVFVQVYLVGADVFGAGLAALDAQRTAGFTVHGLEVLLFVVALVAWLPRTDVTLSAAVAILATAQIALRARRSGSRRCTRSARCSCSSWRPSCSNAAGWRGLLDVR
jgi:hypothetical protein